MPRRCRRPAPSRKGSAAASETALSLSFVIWLLGALVFYAIALQIERRSPATISTPISLRLSAGAAGAKD